MPSANRVATMNNAAIEQRSSAWHALRAGRITASRFADVVSLTKAGKPKAERDKYMREIVFERLAAMSTHEVGGRATKWGEEVEPYGRDQVVIATGHIIEDGGFFVHPRYDFLGASPDGLIGADGGYESKCPMDEAVHVNTMLNGMPSEHIPQVQGGMLVTGRKWWLFASYDPRFPDPYSLYTQVVPRDDAYIDGVLLPGLLQFESEVNAMIEQLKARAA
ncbi:lambda exonuclease family protein [Burkholderia gladioli]|uniref:lambda exonuclease family protein n=1 Tax=Burkholderia gladioli TaxID=28095 RepID=UPI001FC7DACD|nr:lambda exonuclease family protein [Burkholderia gladioli]